MEIIKSFKSETAHIVRNAFSKRCSFSIHGHKYFFEVGIEGPIQADGMVLDFKRLSPITTFIDQFDHSTVLWEEEKEEVKDFFKSNFNRVLVMKKNPTAENMVRLVAKFVSDWLKKEYDFCSLSFVRIWETDSGSARSKDFDDSDVFVSVSEECANG